jgi:hypothetical protein
VKEVIDIDFTKLIHSSRVSISRVGGFRLAAQVSTQFPGKRATATRDGDLVALLIEQF